MHYHEHGCYIRILRLAYARKTGHSSIIPKVRSTSLDKDDNSPAIKKDIGKQKTGNNNNTPITIESFDSSNNSSSNCLQSQHQMNKNSANIQSNFNRNAESCYVHNEQLRSAVEKAIKELNEAKAAQQQVRHPDDETVLANEEEARKQLQQNERLAQQAQHCTCNDNAADDEDDTNSNAGENNEKNNENKKISRQKKLYLNSKFFTPLRRHETIPQIQIRIHDFVNSMLTVRNINNSNNGTINNQAVNSPTRLPSSAVGK